jgi:prepilin-type N-terminal cleavage/methylation domain-containing protein/prepilin-type processing-associated H-X9-DG protein
MQNNPKFYKGLTLVELLVVIAIVAILAVITLTVSSKMIASANENVCASNLRSLAIALNSYASENGGIYPVSNGFADPPPSNWIAALLDGEYLYPKQPDSQRAFVNNQGKNCLYCPAAVRVARPLDGNWNTYAMNMQAGGWFKPAGQESASRLMRIQYPAETALIMDGCRVNGNYYVTTVGTTPGTAHNWFPEMVHPPNLINKPGNPNRGCIVAFVDGHTEFRKSSTIPSDTSKVFWSGSKP